MSSATYTPAQVVKMTGLSLAAIRNYCDRYAEWFSAGAVPPKGTAREFSARDVDLVHFIRSRTSPPLALSHDLIEQALRDGEFEAFVASHPDAGQAAHVEAPVEGAGVDDTMSRDIVPAQITALQIMLKDYGQREAVIQQRADQAALTAAARERELQTQIAGLQRDLGRVEGELQAIKARRPWWRFWQQPKG